MACIMYVNVVFGGILSLFSSLQSIIIFFTTLFSYSILKSLHYYSMKMMKYMRWHEKSWKRKENVVSVVYGAFCGSCAAFLPLLLCDNLMRRCISAINNGISWHSIMCMPFPYVPVWFVVLFLCLLFRRWHHISLYFHHDGHVLFLFLSYNILFIYYYYLFRQCGLYSRQFIHSFSSTVFLTLLTAIRRGAHQQLVFRRMAALFWYSVSCVSVFNSRFPSVMVWRWRRIAVRWVVGM